MLEVGIAAALVALAAVGVFIVSREIPSPNGYWIGAFLAILGSGALTFAVSGAPSLSVLALALGTLYPAFLLAGALRFAGRQVPIWLLPAAVAAGALRGALGLQGAVEASQWLAVATEPTLSLAAAIVLLPGARERVASLAERALVPGLVAIAALDATTALSNPPGAPLPVAYLELWCLVVPFLLAVQISATGLRNEAVLREARERLEERVAERTEELGRSVADLEAQVRERRAAERALRESEERYRIISELSSDYSFAVRMAPDRTMQIEWATDALNRITGYSVEELQGDRWLDLIHPDDRDRIFNELGAVMTGRTTELELRIVQKSGEERWLQVRFGRSSSEPDGTVRLIGAASDISERVLGERDRRRMDHHLQEVQRLESLGVLAGGIAHDFNNVLTVVLGNSHLTLDDLEAGSPLRERVVRIRAAAEYAAGLTTQMLTYSGRASIRTRPLDLSHVVRDMLDLLRASVTVKSSLDVDLSAGLPAIEADETQVRQVILNLVNNAAQAVGEMGGAIRVQTSLQRLAARDLVGAYGTTDLAPGRYVMLEVADSGDGIEPERRARIFEPFFTTKQGGRGLGLAAVLGIVSAHRGVIRVTSELGVGSTFQVFLPPSWRAVEKSEGGSTRSGTAVRSGTVLVIDDDEWVIDVARAVLERAGFRVITALGGAAAIDLLRARAASIDAVVLDLVMPEMSGEETFLEIRRICPDLPVVLASGYDREMTADRFFARGAAGFVYKPYEPDDLVDRVAEAVKR